MDLIPSAFVARPLKIVVIGAGYVHIDLGRQSLLTGCPSISGIQFAHDATTSLSGIDLEIYDRNPSLGGTWYENRYPGYVQLYSRKRCHQMNELTNAGR